MTSELEAKLKTLPASPGVYFHKNRDGEIIYVGKAAVLKNRVRQYFHKDLKDPKTEALKAEIYDTDWIVVDTEMDALFLESEMIKRYLPKWNILLRDDKTVSYVRIDMKSEVPYVSMTRQPLDDQATYVGPFYAKLPVEKALRILRKIFPYYTKPFDGKKSLDTDLGLTPGIEVLKVTPTEYKKNLRKLIRYLEGGREKLLKELEKEMRAAAATEDFEKAAELRNQYFGLKELKKKIVFSDKEFLDISSDQALLALQKLLRLDAPPRRIEGYDISHVQGTDVVASMVVFTNGASDRSEYRKFKLRKQQNNDFESMREVLTRRLKHEEWPYPDLIVLDGGIPQLSAVYDLLAEKHLPAIGRDKSGDHARNAAVKIIIPRPVDAKIEYETISLNSHSHIAKLIARIDEESHRFAITYHRLLRSKSLLK
ncbi:UvrB/UvrC motif-containing protein [Candidatus Saccharibacteria bacterium]|nr:UvrB/UvrC motif-containing protein [Candidatus Saccharibacteria bacterium]MBQ9016935.1 UvrB/UvrC motif-containing protein [Candidatus Saccharibacteria bacterium]